MFIELSAVIYSPGYNSEPNEALVEYREVNGIISNVSGKHRRKTACQRPRSTLSESAGVLDTL